MARAPKIRDIPVFTKEDAGGIHRLFAFLSYFFPIGTLVMWLIFRKKSKFVKMHAETSFGYSITVIVCPIVFGLLFGIVALVMFIAGLWDKLLVFAPIFGIASGAVSAIIGICVFIMTLTSIIRALCGKLESNKQLKLIVREQLDLGNPEAVELIKTDARFADILAEYNARHGANKAE